MRVFWSNGLVGTITTLALDPPVLAADRQAARSSANRASGTHVATLGRSREGPRARTRPSGAASEASVEYTSQMNGAIAMARDGAIATVDPRPPREAQRADPGDVAAPGRSRRRAVRRRRDALRHRARRRRESVLAGQRHRRVRHRARSNKAQAIEYGGVMHRDGRGARGLPASARRADPRHLRRRRPRDRRAVRPAHLRRSRAGSARRSRTSASSWPIRRWRRSCGSSAPPSRSRSCSRAASSTRRKRSRRGSSRASSPDDQVAQRGARHRAAHRRRRAAGRALAQEVRATARGPATDHRRRARRGFDCFDTEDFREGYAAFLAKRKPKFSAERTGTRHIAGRSRVCACSSSRRSWRGPRAAYARGHGRGRDQGREAAGRRRLARLPRAARQRRLGAVPDAQSQQARHRARPQVAARTRRSCCGSCATPTC